MLCARAFEYKLPMSDMCVRKHVRARSNPLGIVRGRTLYGCISVCAARLKHARTIENSKKCGTCVNRRVALRGLEKVEERRDESIRGAVRVMFLIDSPCQP